MELHPGLGACFPRLVPISLHLVTEFHHSVLVGFDLREMERDISVELFEESDPFTNQGRQDR